MNYQMFWPETTLTYNYLLCAICFSKCKFFFFFFFDKIHNGYINFWKSVSASNSIFLERNVIKSKYS